MTKQAAQLSDADIISAFSQAMAEMGLRTDDRIVGDSDLHRFQVDGDPRNTRNGWYVLHMDGLPAGEFGCWKRGINATWCAKKQNELTPGEWSEVTARIERARAERAERERMKHEATAAEAMRIWNEAAPVEGQGHPYLQRKGVNAHGLRIGIWPTGVQALLVPVQDANGKMTSLQAIFANASPTIGRDKDFLAGGKKRGCFFQIGNASATGTVVLCEGYATGASIHEATGLTVIVAFDAGNLKPAAHELRRRWPACEIVVAADNDRWTVPTAENPHVMENPGVTHARELVEALPVRTRLCIPEFSSLDGKPTDFNDLAKLDGLAAVRQQILAVIPAPAEPANDNQPAVPMDGLVAPFGFPHVSEKGQPLNTVENLAYMMGEYGVTARYNQIRKQVELDIPGRNYTADNRANCGLAELGSLCARNRMPRSDLADYVKLIADANAYSPVCEWITSKPWDGVPRIQQLLDTITTTADAALKNALVYRWLLSAVAAAFMPHGFESHGCLVLVGAQGAGKTTWFRRLMPQGMGLVLVGAMLDPNNKDTVTNAVSHWLVELGELDATFRKADIARLKAFITLATDKLRRPYDRIESEYQRRTVFCASVNESNYLVDDTGNRRWWTVPVAGINYQHDLDMQQVWAELLVHHQRGEQHWLTAEENAALGALNGEHEAIDPVEEQILRTFNWAEYNLLQPREMTATEVLVAIGYDKPNKAAATHASKVLRKLTGKDPRRAATGRFFSLPPVLKRQCDAPAAEGGPPW